MLFRIKWSWPCFKELSFEEIQETHKREIVIGDDKLMSVFWKILPLPLFTFRVTASGKSIRQLLILEV